MIVAFALLFALQAAGEFLVDALGLPLPGPVAGMLLLLGVLVARGGPTDAIERASALLLRGLPIFFVPAGVGAVLFIGLFRAEWPAIAVSLVASTLLGIAATGLAGRAFLQPDEGLLPGSPDRAAEPGARGEAVDPAP